MSRSLQVGLHYIPSRYAPASAGPEAAKAFEASGIVDYVLVYDQLVAWFPNSVWKPENIPAAEFAPDGDSYSDPYFVAGSISQATEDIGITISTDALRRGPAETLQAGLTLAKATKGRAALQIGAGELKQAKPFGHKRAQGLKRMEDMFQIIRKLLDEDGLIDHEGNIWNFERAWIGGEREYVPEFWALGGGPKLREIAANYADGYVSLCPVVYSTPEQFAEEVALLRQEIEKAGRDPDSFAFGLWPIVFLWDDPEEFEQVVDNPIFKFQVATLGRLNQRDWRKEGIEPVMPEDWHYAMKMLPHVMSEAEVTDIIDRTPREMCEKFCFKGTPKEVADQLQGYIDAGANVLLPMDYRPFFGGPQDQVNGLHRQLELTQHLKGA